MKLSTITLINFPAIVSHDFSIISLALNNIFCPKKLSIRCLSLVLTRDSNNKANIFLGLIEHELNIYKHLPDYISVHIRFDLERYLLIISCENIVIREQLQRFSKAVQLALIT